MSRFEPTGNGAEPPWQLAVAAVVVSYRAPRYLDQCLTSLRAVALVVQCVVVDNASGDGSADLARAHRGIQVIENMTNTGFAAAANLGISHTTAPLVLLLNCDTQVDGTAILTMVNFMVDAPLAAAVCPRLISADGRDQFAIRSRRPIRVRWAPAACLMLRREAGVAVDWFDPNFFFYNEDVDLGIRLRKAGWEIWHTPAAAVVHHEGKSTDEVRHQAIVHGYRGGLYLVSKHYRWAVRLARAAIWAEIRLRRLYYRILAKPTDKQRAFLDAYRELLAL